MNERAKVQGLWVVLECPSCHAPNTYKKFCVLGKVITLQKTRYMECESCGVGFYFELEELETEF